MTLQALPPLPALPGTVAPLPLVRHPASPQPPALSINACVWRGEYGEVDGWNFHFALLGEVAAVRIPNPKPPARADGLWQTTCLEVFAGVRDEAAYREINFSPSGQWAIYAFSSQRLRDPDAEAGLRSIAPVVACSRSAATFVLQAWIPAAALHAARTGEALEFGLSAVIEAQDGAVSHWALHHPSPQPDFHHRAAFVARP